jgi:hypothetical protein
MRHFLFMEDGLFCNYENETAFTFAPGELANIVDSRPEELPQLIPVDEDSGDDEIYHPPFISLVETCNEIGMCSLFFVFHHSIVKHSQMRYGA